MTPRRRRWLDNRQYQRQKSYHRQSPHIISVMSPDGGGLASARPQGSMPTVMCFDQNPDATLRALESIKRSGEIVSGKLRSIGRAYGPRSKHKNARLRRLGTYRPFEAVQAISVSPAVVLASLFEARRIQSNFQTFIINTADWNQEVLSILYTLGFFDLLGFQTDAAERAAAHGTGSIQLLPMRSGEAADSEQINSLVTDLRNLYPVATEQAEAGLVELYGALVEAIVNVVRHAYPDEVAPGFQLPRRWWMTGAVDREAKWMTAVVYDHGISIPMTLQNWERFAGWKRRMLAILGWVPSASDPKSDGHAIVAALEESVSSTDEPHRGHGLAQMRRFVDRCQDGYLRILSRRGQVVLRPRSDPEVQTFGASVGGTLIEWNVRL